MLMLQCTSLGPEFPYDAAFVAQTTDCKAHSEHTHGR